MFCTPEPFRPTIRRSGFTLIELLVVVAIIAVLAAMLLPVLGKARHRAKLTLDVNNQRQIGMGVMLYADGQDDYYPLRQAAFKQSDQNPYTSEPWTIRNKLEANPKDDRPMYREYLGTLDMLQDPMLPQPLDLEDTSGRGLHIGYELRFGCAMQWNDPLTNNYRINDMPVYNGYEFDILAGCFERNVSWTAGIDTAHPDNAGLSQALLYSDWSEAGYFWRSSVGTRGLVDRSFLYKDGSVRVMRNLRFRDERTVSVPFLPHQPPNADEGFLPPL